MSMTYAAVGARDRGEHETAAAILERQIELYPNLLNGYWQLAGLRTAQGRNQEAIELYRSCLKIDASMANFVNRRIAELEGK